MPTISMFFGITIRMYCSPSEHNPPHFHAYYGDSTATFSLDGSVLMGSLPRKQTTLVLAWIAIHEEELLADWEIAAGGELPFRIDPLR